MIHFSQSIRIDYMEKTKRLTVLTVEKITISKTYHSLLYSDEADIICRTKNNFHT